MHELPTATTPTTTPDVARTLIQIEAAKLVVGQDLAPVLDALGDLIRINGAPSSSIAWVSDILAREQLRAYAAQHDITVHTSRDDEVFRTMIIWTAGGGGMAIVPAGQRPARTLVLLREEVAQRDEAAARAAAFQASVAAGHVEDIDGWHARTSRTAP
ncbi:hypothetical protein ACH4JS_34965 [Streptomyces sp. NPDC017638]|uniref:hypothetical protein n=1 Tax=unclassified Streptomyces TaxID=2593676 RepID=UPI0029673C92|nr:hypothetical protein [Streptomyces sp. SCL15-4]